MTVQPQRRAPRMLWGFTRYLRMAIILVLLLLVVLISRVSADGEIAFEAESGSITGQAQTVSDATASNNSALQFMPSVGGGGASELPTNGTWTNVTANMNVTDKFVRVYAKPGSSEVFTSIGSQSITNELGIWSHTGSGNWTKTGTGSGSANVNIMAMKFEFDPSNPNIFWVAGMYGSPQGFYKTTNGGQTYQKIESINGHNDSISVDMTDPNRQTMLLGPHERNDELYKSTNGGASWTNIAGTIPGSNRGFTTHPVVVNSQTYIIDSETGWGGADPGLFRTTNGGASWTKVSDERTNNDQPLRASNGYIYFRGWEYGPSASFLLRSTDGGQTWTKLTGQSFTAVPIELPDGRLVSMNNSRMIVSSNHGSSWTEFGQAFPSGSFSGQCLPQSLAYSPGQSAIYIAGGDWCGSKPIFRLK